jgi:hypothetical protein
MAISKVFKIHHIDNGFCRVVYKALNEDKQEIFYCLQDEGERYGGVTCYRTTKDFEPNYPVEYGKNMFEVPEGNSEIEIAVKKYLTNGE